MAAHKLTPLQVKNLKDAGTYGDGAGLMIKVTPGGSKSWIHRYMFKGADRWMGLGPYPDVSLAEARELAAANRRKLRAGIDPLGEKKAERAQIKEEKAQAVTFAWCAKQYIDAHRASWSNPKSAQQWENTLATYTGPFIGEMAVAKVDTADVLKVLTQEVGKEGEQAQLWHARTETASRLRGRIEAILDWATVNRHRSGENPARLKGHIDALLPAAGKIKKVKHHAALPYAEMKPFMTELRKQAGIAARACEFAILTAARSGEVRGASWAEFDLDAGVWTIPGERMKADKEHRVPLSVEARQVIRDMKAVSTSDTLVFPGAKKDAPLSDMSLTAVLKRMERADLTMHGFRSTFRDWAAEQTNYPHEMAEMALAHTVGDKVEAAYRRGDMLEKRREMMQEWSAHCGPK